MKIAYIVPYVPNLIRTRPYNLISQLVALGHEVTVFTLGAGKQDRDDARAIQLKVKQLYYQEQGVLHSSWNSLTAVPTKQPLQSVYSWNPQLANQLVKSISSDQDAFDVIHVEHLRGSRYGRLVKARFAHVPVIWDSVDCISYLFKQASAYGTGGYGKFITRFELGRTRLMEGKLVGEFDRVLVTSEMDKNALLDLVPSNSESSSVHVLPNGVDLDFFYPNPSVQRDNETLVFSGKMSYHANISMVKFLVSKIMPGVWAKRSNVKLLIVGKDPAAEVRAFGRDPRITVTGMVDDIRPYLWKATCAVVPLIYGAGIQNKILEAMACGTPVITTSKPLSSLMAVPGKDLLIADGSAAFGRTILDLLGDKNLQRDVSSNGASYTRRNHSWITIANQLLLHYGEVAKILKDKSSVMDKVE
jgi:glycosyltransferase involved in cell wall biosynthesis